MRADVVPPQARVTVPRSSTSTLLPVTIVIILSDEPDVLGESRVVAVLYIPNLVRAGVEKFVGLFSLSSSSRPLLLMGSTDEMVEGRGERGRPGRTQVKVVYEIAYSHDSGSRRHTRTSQFGWIELVGCISMRFLNCRCTSVLGFVRILQARELPKGVL